MKAEIIYCRKRVIVACDDKCSKAWGIQSRPKIQLSDDPDDFCFLSDSELGDAPVNPGTYEGGVGKPVSKDCFPNRWCARECERCQFFEPDEEVVLSDWNERRYNQPRKH